MAGKNPQTFAKRARELAVREKRDRKRAKKAENAARRAAGEPPAWETDVPTEGDGEVPEVAEASSNDEA